jgi:hypothetical protein
MRLGFQSRRQVEVSILPFYLGTGTNPNAPLLGSQSRRTRQGINPEALSSHAHGYGINPDAPLIVD